MSCKGDIRLIWLFIKEISKTGLRDYSTDTVLYEVVQTFVIVEKSQNPNNYSAVYNEENHCTQTTTSFSVLKKKQNNRLIEK